MKRNKILSMLTYQRLRRVCWLTAVSLLPLLLLTIFLSQTLLALAPQTNNLTELLPVTDLDNWFLGASGYTPDGRTFSAYSIEPMDDTLYLGFGTSTPAHRNGAVLASYHPITGLQTISSVHEQGFMDMHIVSETIYIPGADPCCGDLLNDEGQSGSYSHQWDWGNVYVYSPSAPIIKRRNLTNTIHSWGMWYDVNSDILYAAVSSHLADSPPPDHGDSTWTGEVYSSTNQGDDWTLLANRDDGVGTYRTYDIIGFNNKLFIHWYDVEEIAPDVYTTASGLAESSNGGTVWNRLATPEVQIGRRLEIIKGQLTALKKGRDGLVRVDTSDVVTTELFPGFQTPERVYNFIAEDGAGNVYVVTANGRLMRSADLVTWDVLAATDMIFTEVSYWPQQNKLILSSRGSDAKLWELDVLTAVALSPPATEPILNIALNGDTLDLDWQNISGDYRVYRSTSPYFMAEQYDWLADTTNSDLNDNNLASANVVGDVNNNYFYLARAVNGDGHSKNSNWVGEFDFAIVPGS